MSDRSSIDFLRRRVKQLVRDERFNWLALPARRFWYYWRTVGELGNLPRVLARLDKHQRSLPTAELIDYVFTEFGGMFRPFQNKTELHRFVARVHELMPRTILEIGTARGGTLILLSTVAAPNAELVSIDLPAGLYGGGYPRWKGYLYRRLMGEEQTLHLIRGDSHEARTFEKAREALGGKPVDLLFIDGDHSYGGARHDFFRYRSLLRPGGLIAFHDILENRTAPEISVAPLWRELAGSLRAEEIVDSYEQGECGIGIVTVPNQWEEPLAFRE
jgi:predicted O-methyltransferase YrrM